jgi:hypothetical protein
MRPLVTIALAACATAMCSCAHFVPSSPAAPPRLETPRQAAAPCHLFTLKQAPQALAEADVEIGYVTRGAQLVACDAARQLEVDTHEAEHRLIDQQIAERDARLKPWWAFWR